VIPAVLCLLLATGCDEQTTLGPTVQLNERFTLAPGETAIVADTSLRVQFVRVSNDSRCPADVVCIQGGDALVHILVNGGGYVLHTGDASQASIAHGGVSIELVELQPYPFSSRTIQPGDYRATLRATR
jgi:hypothetical protein